MFDQKLFKHKKPSTQISVLSALQALYERSELMDSSAALLVMAFVKEKREARSWETKITKEVVFQNFDIIKPLKRKKYKTKINPDESEIAAPPHKRRTPRDNQGKTVSSNPSASMRTSPDPPLSSNTFTDLYRPQSLPVRNTSEAHPQPLPNLLYNRFIDESSRIANTQSRRPTYVNTAPDQLTSAPSPASTRRTAMQFGSVDPYVEPTISERDSRSGGRGRAAPPARSWRAPRGGSPGKP